MASPEHYGLALVLGGGEVSMQEMAQLYAMLANQGVLKPLRLDIAAPRSEGTRLISPEASFMAMDILRQHVRPDELDARSRCRRRSIGRPAPAGLSAMPGRRASSVHVLVVWVGNFDGSGNPAFIGADAAAPLFFQIIDAVEAEHPDLPQPAGRIPPGIKPVEICLASGDLPNQWCPQRGRTWFIPGKSPIRVSNVHRPVIIDDATGRPACPPYVGKRVHQELYEFWSSDLSEVFAKAGIPRRKPPQNEACANAGVLEGSPPRITSPLRGASYVLRLGGRIARRSPFPPSPMPMCARSTGSRATISWAAANRASLCSGSRYRPDATPCVRWTIMAAATSGRWMSARFNKFSAAVYGHSVPMAAHRKSPKQCWHRCWRFALS